MSSQPRFARCMTPAALALALAGSPWLRAQEPAASTPNVPVTTAGGRAEDAEAPLVAGADGVPAPKRRQLVMPEYPERAKALGIRGIVLVEVLVERDGTISKAELIRSIPELDEAALAAVRQWEYEPTVVAGKPVRVRLTVPITFTLKLPELQREEGIPELRQGVMPGFPQAGPAGGRASVEADVTLDATGHVADAAIVLGDSPWTEALLNALRTWVFAWDDKSTTLSFRLRAEFKRTGNQPGQIQLATSGARRVPAAAAQAAAEAETPATTPAAAAPTGASAPTPPTAPGPATSVPTTSASTPSRPDAPTKPAPPIEVLHVPPPPAAAAAAAQAAPAAPQPGVSLVRDVDLALGVPDLSQGRRPVVPPFARMAGVTGTVVVEFSVAASGATAVKTSQGPDLLRFAAEQMVASWIFRRTTTDRLFLVAQIDYAADTAKGSVKPIQ
jgi:TonB family protein